MLALRRGKGMVLDAADHDTWSVGSFFTNPVLPAADVPGRAGPAALAGRAGPGEAAGGVAHRTQRLPSRPCPVRAGGSALSGKHVLALSNRGDGTARDLLALAREVRDGVRARFGVELVPEPVLVGCAL